MANIVGNFLWISMFVLLWAYPGYLIWMIIHCAESKHYAGKTKGLLIAGLFLIPFGPALYGYFLTGNKLHKRISAVLLLFPIIFILLVIVSKLKILGG